MRSIWQRGVVGVVLAIATSGGAPLAAQPPVAQAPATRPPVTRDGWNDSVTLALVTRATTRRQAQLADTALHDYRALARGFLTFLGQVGEGLSEPPRVIQATQVATEVYWHAPNLSKQRVVGTRDTTVLPTDNDFYRDRYQIVQNNFPEIIRVGEGRDVADVPHPLSVRGLGEYDFAIRDSLRIRSGDRTLSVLEVQVRPRDSAAPRLVGALFLDRDDAQVVRMAFTFTRAAYLDKRNEDVSIVLENALVRGRYWLPRRQEVEVRRTGTWMDFPARGIIRGRWEIGEYAVNQGLALSIFGGPELTFLPPEQRRRYAFGGGTVLDSLPADVRMVTDEDVRRVQAQARALVQQQVLARTRSSALAARRISDFARVNRVEGLALGAGWAARLGNGFGASVQGRYGIDDEAGKGRLTLSKQWASGIAVRASGYIDFREAGDEPEVSLARNSLAAQEFGSDYTDPYHARGGELAADVVARSGFRTTFSVAWEKQHGLDVHATPFSGQYEPTLPAGDVSLVRLGVDVERPTALGPLGVEWRLSGSVRTSLYRSLGGCGDFAFRPQEPAIPGDLVVYDDICDNTLRAAATLSLERPFGRQRLVSRTSVAGVTGNPAIQELAYFGGPVTAPGYRFHELLGRAGGAQRVEWRTPVPFLPLSLGRYGRAPSTATLAPYANMVYLHHAGTRYDGPTRGAGWYPSLGVGAYTFFDLVRFDVARGLRDGRWTFSVDVTRDFWRVL